MITEDKTKTEALETPQEVPAPLESKRRQGLRELLAAVQCWSVRRRHHVRRYTGARLARMVERFLSMPVARLLGEELYSLGFQGEYTAICTARILRTAGLETTRAAAYAGLTVGNVLLRAVKTVFHELFDPFYVFFRGVRNLFMHAHVVHKEKGIFAAVWESLCYLGCGIKLYARLIPRAVAYVLPVCAAALFMTVARTMLSYNYTLAVQVEGDTVGYVQSENVFDSAKEAVNERINYAGTNATSWDIQPMYTLSIASTEVLDENQMADAILRTASDEITEGTALYIDGNLTAVCADGNRLRTYLNGLTAPYENDEDPTTIVRFNRDVQLVNGIFFTDSFVNYQDVISRLSGVQQEEKDYTVVAGDSISLIASKNGLTVSELCDLNAGLTTSSALFPGDILIVTKEEALLEVRITRTETWTEEIPYTTERSQSDEYAFGSVRTVQEGQNGVKSITAEKTYDTDGNVLETNIVDTQVVTEPVTKKIVTGTKLASGNIATVGNGQWMWPVPGYSYCSRWFSGSHKGVDICASYGTPIYAADSGVVTASGSNAAGSGYGLSIIINHGNGYVTYYAHCSALAVSAGQSVSRGTLIGYVGSTGRSTGNHCHFEIRLNGVIQAPQNYFNR